MPQKKLYNHKSIYEDYACREYLFKSEEQIIKELAAFLPGARMLDMGVGGGRTTSYFAPLVKSYTGADYSPGMISECRKKFGNRFDFIECDARHMSCFESNSFDFVLFSFNGIDSFGQDDRSAALKEIRRVLVNGGYFCFSSHNLDWQGLGGLFSIGYIFRKLFLNNTGNNKKHRTGESTDAQYDAKKSSISSNKVFSALKSIFIYVRLHFLNLSFDTGRMIKRLRSNGYGMIYDNSLGGKARIYYISYGFQLIQLQQHGFYSIISYSNEGVEAGSSDDLRDSPWIYFICRVKK